MLKNISLLTPMFRRDKFPWVSYSVGMISREVETKHSVMNCLIFFFKDFIYLFERERESEQERARVG